jgi:hypothetical protein
MSERIFSAISRSANIFSKANRFGWADECGRGNEMPVRVDDFLAHNENLINDAFWQVLRD